MESQGKLQEVNETPSPSGTKKANDIVPAKVDLTMGMKRTDSMRLSALMSHFHREKPGTDEKSIPSSPHGTPFSQPIAPLPIGTTMPLPAQEERPPEGVKKLTRKQDHFERVPSAVEEVEGFMTMYLKKNDNKKRLFNLGKSKYYVVASTENPALKIFTNENKSSEMYILSLCNSTLSFEPDESNMVTENCFCIDVKIWTKQTTTHYKRQCFVFREEKQEKLLTWVKCIHLAIKNASAKHDSSVELFRSTLGFSSLVISSDIMDDLDDNDSEVMEIETTDIDFLRTNEHDALLRGTEDSINPTTKENFNSFLKLNNFLKGSNNLNHTSTSATSTATTTATSTSTSSTTAAATPTSNATGNFNRIIHPNIQANSLSNSAHILKEKALTLSPKIKQSSIAMLNRLQIKSSPQHTSNHSKQNSTHAKSTNSADPNVHDPFNDNKDYSASSSTSTGAEYTIEDRNELLRQINFNKATSQCNLKPPQSATMTNMTANDPIEPINAKLFIFNITFVVYNFYMGYFSHSILWPLCTAGFLIVLSDIDNYAKQYTSNLLHFMVSYSSGYVRTHFGLASLCCYIVCYTLTKTKSKMRLLKRMNAQRITSMKTKKDFSNFELPSWVIFSDVERVEWLNKAISRCWPFLKTAIRNSVMENLNPVLEVNKPSFLTCLSFINIDLGHTSPMIESVKILPNENSNMQISIDIHVRFESSENQIAELKLASSVGASAKVKLQEIALNGTLRLTLKPLCPVWPGFSGISVSFISDPEIDFALTAAKINISNIPFAFDWLQTLLHELIMENIVWPKVLDIPLFEPEQYLSKEDLKSYQQAKHAASHKTSTPVEHIHLSNSVTNKTIYGPSVISVHLRQLKFTNQVEHTYNNTAEYYCTMYCKQDSIDKCDNGNDISFNRQIIQKQRYQSDTKRAEYVASKLENQVNAVFDTFVCMFDSVYEFYYSDTTCPCIVFELWQYNRFVSDEMIGSNCFNIGVLPCKKDNHLNVPLSVPKLKQVNVEVNITRRLISTVNRPQTTIKPYLPEGLCTGILLATLQNGTNLTPANYSTFCDPFAILLCEKKQFKSNSVKSNGNLIQWNEHFHFFIQNSDTAQLKIEIFDKDITLKELSIGYVTIPLLELRGNNSAKCSAGSSNYPVNGAKHGSLSIQLDFKELMS